MFKKEKFFSKCIKYHNYSFFQKDAIFDHGFLLFTLLSFDLLIKENKNDTNIQTALENSKVI